MLTSLVTEWAKLPLQNLCISGCSLQLFQHVTRLSVTRGSSVIEHGTATAAGYLGDWRNHVTSVVSPPVGWRGRRRGPRSRRRRHELLIAVWLIVGGMRRARSAQRNGSRQLGSDTESWPLIVRYDYCSNIAAVGNLATNDRTRTVRRLIARSFIADASITVARGNFI